MEMLDDLRDVRDVAKAYSVLELTARYLDSSSIFMVKGRDRGGRPVGV
jgi:hypothetical protein